MSYLSALPIDLRLEILCYFSDPYFIVNDLMQIPAFYKLWNNNEFCQNFARKYITSNNYKNFSYVHIENLYKSHALSTLTSALNYFKKIIGSPDGMFQENLMNAAKFNWDLFVDHIDHKDDRLKHVHAYEVILESAYNNSLNFLAAFYTTCIIPIMSVYWPWYIYEAGMYVALFRGHRLIYEYLEPHLVGNTYTISIHRMFYHMEDRFINEKLRLKLNVSQNDYLGIMVRFLAAFVKNKDVVNIYNEYVVLYGADNVKKLLLNLITKSHLEWITHNHGINAKPNMNFLLSMGLDKNLLNNEQLKLWC